MNIEVKHPTDMYHIEIIMEDVFTFATVKKQLTVSGQTLLRIQEDIGKIVVNKFNPNTHTRDQLRLKEVKRA